MRSIDGSGGSFGGGGAGFRSLFPSIVFLLLAYPNIPGFRIGSQDDDQIVAIADSLLLRLKHRFVASAFPEPITKEKKGEVARKAEGYGLPAVSFAGPGGTPGNLAS